MSVNILKTRNGSFVQDEFGLYHYQFDLFGDVYDAARDALNYRPAGVAWFWFNDTPTPIKPGDDARSLAIRWYRWRKSYQQDPRSLLDCFLSLIRESRAE